MRKAALFVAFAFLALLSGAGCGGAVAVTEDGCALASPPPNAGGPPATLLSSGLYCNDASDVRADVIEYEPRFPLWADGADVRRFVAVPSGSRIDDGEDAWSFPVGTRAWKEVRVGGERIETRLIERFGAGDDDWTFMGYEWRGDGSDADPVPNGDLRPRGTSHEILGVATCIGCHGSRPERLLGLSPVQTGTTPLARRLWAADELARAPEHVVLPADPVALAALGYLHGNCSHCHDGASDTLAPNSLGLRLRAGTSDATESDAYRTAVSVPTVTFRRGTPRIAPGHPEGSAVFFRMAERGDSVQMPPIGTERVDSDGLATVSAWISSL